MGKYDALSITRLSITALIGAVVFSGLSIALEWVKKKEVVVSIPSPLQMPMQPAQGGKGGDAKVGGSGIAVGGKAGGGGPPGAESGGSGGNAEVQGSGIAIGGDGGEAGQVDRGGRGGRSPLERAEELGLLDEGIRRVLLLTKLRQEYSDTHGGIAPDLVPHEWLNKRLEELGHAWRVRKTANGTEIFPPSKP